MKWLMLSILLCSCMRTDHPLKYGAEYRLEAITEIDHVDRFNRALSVIALVASEQWPVGEVERLLGKLRIRICDPLFIGKGILTECKNQLNPSLHIGGAYNYPNIVRFAWRGPLWNSGFGHEVLHHIVHHLDKDAMHSYGPPPVVYTKTKYLELDLMITEELRKLNL